MKRITLLVTLLFGCATIAMAGSYNYVEPEEFRLWLEMGRDMVLVDIQVPAEFQKHHFRGSLETNAYPVKTSNDKKKLDKVVPLLSTSRYDVVVICPRGGGAKSTCEYLKEKGIDAGRIFILEEGMLGWPYQELTVAGRI